MLKNCEKTTDAIVVAAGRGSRFGGETPKQYLLLRGCPLLRHSLVSLGNHPAIRRIAVVIHPDDRALYDATVEGLELLPPVAGGASRQESVRNGLESLESAPPDRVLIHDGARPFVDHETIDALLAALEQHDGAIPALPVVDSLKQGAGQRITGEAEREGLWRAQTPQAFRYAAILAAHRAQAGNLLTDDAAVARAQGCEVALVPGSEENIKVTDGKDLELAEKWLRARLPAPEVRVGQGVDVHRFGPGDHVMLCGVRIEHDYGLVGHSDADVALHALCDAIFGALGAGDIGTHFPPSDPRWSGAGSDRFLSHAGTLVVKGGGRILHLDLTIICEEPRVGPHRQAMAERIGSIMGLGPGRISVKATTTEKLGFTGRGEGIAAQATATLEMPSAQERER
jgi:2-C-methyl-D-erythritol 4-phosphate cytidylyltransferase/2-C-methyl-D-erythritol 2,4-cyclodiphosphate synthase